MEKSEGVECDEETGVAEAGAMMHTVPGEMGAVMIMRGEGHTVERRRRSRWMARGVCGDGRRRSLLWMRLTSLRKGDGTTPLCQSGL